MRLATLVAASHHQVYFANAVTLEDLTKEDGQLLGEIFVNQIKRARKRGGWKKRAELGMVGVDEFCYSSVAMREVLLRHPWFRVLLHTLSLNQITGALTVKTALADMKDQDAINLEKGLSTIILSNTEVSASVDHWIAQNAALLLLAYTQNSKKLSLLAQDTFCILVGFKPALDAHRVDPGAEMEDHQVMPPLQEATVGKGVETVFEVIPSSVVQIFAILLAKERKVDASISTLVSATTIGFTSSMLSYDWDTSPTSRLGSPLFYGFVPDKAVSRALCFISMLALSFANVLLQTFACALLAITNWKWLLYYLFADMGLYFL
ncbi:hypothetical protein TL16_g08891 [Triparma laevis f. inornata]|uniref:Uncharacterized protein n=1 Tax=Triparma laevis f. inornata TaxID=1714386 RepID=A0A9W7EJW0_9STRA|nr:hypothetical protein TL16_g08891 [Triparma laevis f. inornata]